MTEPLTLVDHLGNPYPPGADLHVWPGRRLYIGVAMTAPLASDASGNINLNGSRVLSWTYSAATNSFTSPTGTWRDVAEGGVVLSTSTALGISHSYTVRARAPLPAEIGPDIASYLKPLQDGGRSLRWIYDRVKEINATLPHASVQPSHRIRDNLQILRDYTDPTTLIGRVFKTMWYGLNPWTGPDSRDGVQYTLVGKFWSIVYGYGNWPLDYSMETIAKLNLGPGVYRAIVLVHDKVELYVDDVLMGSHDAAGDFTTAGVIDFTLSEGDHYFRFKVTTATDQTSGTLQFAFVDSANQIVHLPNVRQWFSLE